MLIPIDEVVHFDVVTHAAASGTSTNADSSGTFNVFEEATDTAILSAQALVLRASQTGVYRGTFTASAANGFEAGKWYSVVASSTVATIAGKCVAMGFRVAPAESSPGVPKGDVSHWLGTAPATPTVAGVPEVDLTHMSGNVPAVSALTALSSGVGLVTAEAGTLSTTQMTTDIQGFGDDFFNDRWLLYFASTPNTGWVAVVTDYVSATGLITFSPAAPNAVSVADTAYLWPLAATGLAIGNRIGSLSGNTGNTTNIGLIKAATDNLPSAVKKNTARRIPFKMVLSSDHVSNGTTLTVAATRSLDGAAFGVAAGAVTEIGFGWYFFDAAAGDLNGDSVALKFTAATADQTDLAILTEP